MIRAGFGVDVSRAAPKLMKRFEGDTIGFVAGKDRFEVTTIKEDTGEPHTIVAWRTAG